MKRIHRILPHINIVLACLLTILLIVDRVNAAVRFIDNNITKGIIAVFIVTVLWASALLIIYQRKGRK